MYATGMSTVELKIFNLGTGATSWSLCKQWAIADSSCYTEYIALSNASHEAMFLCMLLKGLNCHPQHLTVIYCDNDATIRLAKDQV
jgi:hypothetical protein